ncbi:MAG: hypothetical protein K0S51_1053 [Bacillales bacterium]|jgi:hypothetical protein|nr:hypothetical protein [Bacillales bacterium]
MKKLKTLLIICISIVLVFTIYYGTLISKVSSAAQFELEQISGDKSEVEDLLFYGSNQTIFNSEFIVNAKGENLFNSMSYFEKLNSRYYIDNNIFLLYKEHRNFMRGKTNRNSFYEDQKELVSVVSDPRYFDKENIEFTIEILNKKSENKEQYTFSLKNDKQSNYIDIIDVQKRDGKVYTMIQKHEVQMLEYAEIGFFDNFDYFLVTFDIEKNSIDIEEKLFDSTVVNKKISTYMKVDELNLNAASRYFIMVKTTMERVKEGQGDGLIDKDVAKEFVIYDYENKKLLSNSIDLMKYPNYNTMYYSENEIFIQIASGTEHKFIILDTISGKIMNEVDLNIPLESNLHLSNLEDHKLFTLTSKMKETGPSDYELFVTDIITGKQLYHGKFNTEGNNNMMINRVFLQK